MATITSHDSGCNPFKTDISRGKWTSLKDFYSATIMHSIGIKSFVVLPHFLISQAGILSILPFTLGLLILSIPLYFIQSFMGQFSSSGFISAYRIAPLFKGVGYAILLINLASICYTIALASYTLIYFFGSFNPELPWMTCNNGWNTENCTVTQKFELNHTNAFEESWSSVEYFVYGVRQLPFNEDSEVLIISWRLLIGVTITWILVTAIILQGVEFIGKLLRYFLYISSGLLSILVLRVLIIHDSFNFIYNFFVPDLEHVHYLELFCVGIILPIAIHGDGGGSILTLASYNNFHSEIRLYSWINGIILLTLTLIAASWATAVDNHLSENFNFKMYYYGSAEVYFPFIGVPFFLGQLAMSNLWSMMFFTLAYLGELSGAVIQMLSIITAIFDEYNLLRTYKRGIIIVLSFCLFLISTCFTTNAGTSLIQPLYNASNVSLCVICFIDIMIVVWIYGRERFQRDIKFLLQGKTYKTWEFMILRFVTPFLLFFFILINIAIYIMEIPYRELWLVLLITISVKIMPTVFILSWIFYGIIILPGGICTRFKRLCTPTDWYPVDPVDKRQYEEKAGACAENVKDLCSNIEIENIECDDN